jgi:outer membrane protein assembly factor BamE
MKKLKKIIHDSPANQIARMFKFTSVRVMLKACLFLTIGLSTGCSWSHAYQPDIQQGNIVSQSMITQIKPGMTRDQVENILGQPILSNPFNENHLAYVYTFQHNGGGIARKNIDVYLSHGKVSHTNISEGKIKIPAAS